MNLEKSISRTYLVVNDPTLCSSRDQQILSFSLFPGLVSSYNNKCNLREARLVYTNEKYKWFKMGADSFCYVSERGWSV